MKLLHTNISVAIVSLSSLNAGKALEGLLLDLIASQLTSPYLK